MTYYQKNKKRILANRKKYYAENKEKCLETIKAWRSRNPERVKFLINKFYQKNKEKIKKYNAEYFQANKQKIYMRRRLNEILEDYGKKEKKWVELCGGGGEALQKENTELKARLNYIQNGNDEVFVPPENSQNRGED